jgi:hypothetical protein
MPPRRICDMCTCMCVFDSAFQTSKHLRHDKCPKQYFLPPNPAVFFTKVRRIIISPCFIDKKTQISYLDD